MRKPIPVLIGLCTAIFFISCQKEVDLTVPSQGNNGGSGAAARDSYYPLTKDSWWKYKDSLTGVVTDGKIINRTKTVNGIVYTAIVPVSAPATDTSWFASPRPNYYCWFKGVSPAGASLEILLHYLNDTASAGYSWRYNAGQGNGFTAYITTTIVEKNISMTVSGKKYTNVIHSRLDLSYDMLGMIVDFGSYHFYTAKGVGVIKIQTDLSMLGMTILQTSTDLLDYAIK